MTNIIIQVLLCSMVWAVVFVRLRRIRWDYAFKDNATPFKAWLMMFFFAIALTSMMDFAVIFDAHTANNLSVLISASSFLFGINIAIAIALDVLKTSALIRSILTPLVWFLLIIVLITAGSIYALFLWQQPEFGYYTPIHTFPEAIFKQVIYFFETLQCILLIGLVASYLPSEQSTVMRVRLIVSILSCTFAGFSALIVAVAGYLWPAPMSSWMLNLVSPLLAVVAIIFYTPTFLSNKIYVRFTLIEQRIQNWYAFQDLKPLIAHITYLFPTVGLPPGNPNFLQFVQNPEDYLYKSLIIILDGKVMLDDLMVEIDSTPSEAHEQDDPEDELLLKEVFALRRLYNEAAPTSENFFEIIKSYQQASLKRYGRPKSQLVENPFRYKLTPETSQSEVS